MSLSKRILELLSIIAVVLLPLLRCIGNYSTDLDKFTSVYKSGETPVGFYPTFKNTLASISSDTQLTREENNTLDIFNQKVGKFSCPKFTLPI